MYLLVRMAMLVLVLPDTGFGYVAFFAGMVFRSPTR